MRILLLHSSSDIYGASKIFLQTVKLLKKQGYHTVVALSYKGPLSIELEKLGVEVHIINLAILRRKYFNLPGIVNRYKRWGVAVKDLSALIDKHQIDTIYSNTIAVLVGGYIAKQKNLQHIWHLHEIIEKPVFLHKFLASRLRKWADKIIVVSKAVETHWKDAITAPKMFQVYNGLPDLTLSTRIISSNANALSGIEDAAITDKNYRSDLNIPKDAIVIGMAARIHFWKGQTYFIDIARTLLLNEKMSYNNAKKAPLYFIIAGDPFPGYEHLQLQMENAIKESDLSDRIFYIGLVKDMDLFYRAINLLILPSQQPDPLPTVVLEAMQYALPIVATAQGGALEMVAENETGIFIPLHNVTAAADKITNLLNEAKLVDYGNAGKKRVNKYFSVDAFEKNIVAVFEKPITH
jgi:glycosyltransferase involved in cell wall biosynthesis